MPRQFTLPDLGEGLTEAEIVAVLVREGDIIREDAPLLEVETDKAQVEIPSPVAGRAEKIHVTRGQTVKVGAVLVTFADNGAPAPSGAPAPAAPATPRETAAPGGAVAATPATRRLARELSMDLHAVRGSGPGGRILDADVRAAAGAWAPAAPTEAHPQRATSAVRDAAPAGPAKPLAAIRLRPPPLPRFQQG